jgi:membrane protease YdiL (CAAX protease family)
MLNAILSFAAAAVILYFWLADFRSWKAGKPFARALPGATSAPMRLVWLSAGVSVGIVVVESVGEYILGVTQAQSTVPAYYLIPMICAGLIEEVIFRGYLVIERKGRKVMIGSIIVFSIVFALIHGHLLAKGTGGIKLTLAPGPMWWTLILFVNSLWWYAVRFMPSNKDRSLLPCFAGHIASNLAVFAVKAAEGFVTF